MRMMQCACFVGAVAALSPLAERPVLHSGSETASFPGGNLVLASLKDERANLDWAFSAFKRDVADPIAVGSLGIRRVASATADQPVTTRPVVARPMVGNTVVANPVAPNPVAANPVAAIAAAVETKTTEPKIATKPVFTLGPQALAFDEPGPNAFFDPKPIGPSKPIVLASLGLIPATPVMADLGPKPTSDTPNFAYLAYYVYSETPPPEKPAHTVLSALSDIPEGTVLEEIKRAADAFGLDYGYLKAVAKVESDFDPKQRTGSYVGLYQLSKYEFNRYGEGDILDPRDNAIAAAYKIIVEAELFELQTHRKPSLSDLYLIHQQGIQGAEQHIGNPDRVAWESMCATDEGQQKGEKWCKRAIWANTLPEIKKAWGSVEKLTSGAFVGMWANRLASLYSRYSTTADATVK
jgi:Transglycosylase SLT domain